MTSPSLDPAFTASGDCPECEGTGNDPQPVHRTPCTTCQGTGTDPRAVLRAIQAVGVFMQRAQTPAPAVSLEATERTLPIPESLVKGLGLQNSQMELVQNETSPRWTALSATASGSHDDSDVAVSRCLDKLITRLVVRLRAPEKTP